MVPILFKLSIMLSLVNARTVSNIKTLLPSRRQTEVLAASVCNDLGFIFDDEETAAACPDSFRTPSMDPIHSTEVKVRCRSRETILVEVTPSNNFQLVVVVPMTSEKDDILKYSLIDQDTKFSEISVTSVFEDYVIFSIVLDKDGRPAEWQSQVEVPAWNKTSVPQHRNYDVKVQFEHVSKSAIVTWNDTGESDVCYVITNTCTNGSAMNISIWPEQDHQVVFEDLPYDEQCTAEVKGFYGSTMFKYRTHAQKDIVPEIPRNISLVAIPDGEAWKVRVQWAKPRNLTPEGFNLTLGADDNQTMVVPGNATEAIFAYVTGEGLYNVSIFSYNGQSEGHAFRRALFPARPAGERRWLAWKGAASGAWATIALAVLAGALCWLRQRNYHIRKPMGGQDSKPLDESLEPLEPACEDRWEIRSDRLFLHEVIGEGAFGVVRRGSLAPAGKEVAVKMLKDFPSIDEVRAFRLEMELMKSVGAHPHVVSLVGCCSTKRPLIVAEYCARGDLLSFLRCSWDIMISKRNAKYYNNIDTSDYRNDLFKCKIQKEHSRLVVNKMYDVQGVCDTDLSSLDLLSFCRQIAMGMKFLATNRLVHRDLAARNVLVTGNRTLKIADFGLSRDVYEENQYKQKGNGKMPVKWMALESLTRRIYTSQSDVWSFGVVVWEVVTVGGAPYPEVPASRLPRLLRAGYRMPRPPNCSKQLYELMVSCWRVHPRERPTFAELHQRLDELLNCACADEYLCLELDDQPPPMPRAQRYLQMIMRGKRAWTREPYERPLKAVQGNHNHYTSPPVTLSKAPV